MKAADKLRKQLAAAERSKEALLREAAQRDLDHQSRAAEAMDTSMQSSEQVAEMRLLVQVAEAEKSEAVAASSRLQAELEAVKREAAAERMALQAVFEKEHQEAELAREEHEVAICIKIDEFGIKMDGFCIQIDGFCIKNDDFRESSERLTRRCGGRYGLLLAALRLSDSQLDYLLVNPQLACRRGRSGM